MPSELVQNGAKIENDGGAHVGGGELDVGFGWVLGGRFHLWNVDRLTTTSGHLEQAEKQYETRTIHRAATSPQGSLRNIPLPLTLGTPGAD